MAPKRYNIDSLINQHGSVEKLAHKLGVHARSVQRWRNDGVDPSPLAKEKLDKLSAPDAQTELKTMMESTNPKPSPQRKALELPHA